MSTNKINDTDAIKHLTQQVKAIKNEIAKIIVGQEQIIDELLISLLAKASEEFNITILVVTHELDVVKRGRNYKRTSHPKNTDIITYKMSSGFEAMIGYLYLNNDRKRLDEIMNYILGGNYEKENN